MFGEASSEHNKALVTVNGKPLICYSLDILNDAGITKAYIVVGKNKDRLIETIGKRYKDIDLRYVVQDQPNGLVNAFSCAFNEISDDVVLCLSDEIFVGPRFKEQIASFDPDQKAFWVSYVRCKVNDEIRQNYSVSFDPSGKTSFCEKPIEVYNDIKGAGVSVFSKRTVDVIKKVYDVRSNFPYDLCDLYNTLIDRDISCNLFEIADYEINVNTEADRSKACSLLDANTNG